MFSSFLNRISFVQQSLASLLIMWFCCKLTIFHNCNKCNFDHEEVKYLKSYHRKFKRNLASGIALPRRRKLCSRHSLFNFYERAKIAKLIYYPQLLTNSSSQKNAACSLSRVHKTLNDRIIHNKFILSRDIAKNPGPHEVIYSNKTIYAPYS